MLNGACGIRQQAIEVLEHHGILRKIIFVCRSLSNLWRAVKAGLGVTVRFSFDQPNSISKLNRLPKLGNLREYIDRNHYQLEEVQQQLYDELKQQLQQYLEK